MKDQDRQAETIMVRRTLYVAQLLRLQLRRCEVGRTDRAGKRAAFRGDLERVAIDHADTHPLVDQEIALVDVTNEYVRGVERLEGGGRVAGGEDHVVPANFGEVAAAVGGAVKLMELL